LDRDYFYLMKKTFFFVLIQIILTLPLFAQGRSDFYDNYDYSLRNYNGGETIGSEGFQDYKLPRPRKKPGLLEPKSVQPPSDPTLLIPPATGLRRAATTNTEQQQASTSNLPINPITGELNVDAILRNQESSKQKKDMVKKLRDEKSKEIYKESQLRRSEIIFFTTLPFAVGGSVAISLFINNFSNGFYKSNAGAAFVAVSAIGFSFANVYLDRVTVNEFEKERNTSLYQGGQMGTIINKIEVSIPFWEIKF
jgi:hypothetical protein